MELSYKIEIESPATHQARVLIKGKKEKNDKFLDFFLPRWSPGSYLIREYSRHLSNIKAENSVGERLYLEQIDVSTFRIDWEKSELKGKTTTPDEFVISYNVYCHELTVRTSHIDLSHAFLHLPTLLMGVLEKEMLAPKLELFFPPTWSKLTTALKDISQKREHFFYEAKNYDELIDSPIEIGCQETDGFEVDKIPHDLAFYGQLLPHSENIKADIEKIVRHISQTMGGLPYEKYSFLIQFIPGLYGGLEHTNSTVLQYDPTQITNRKGYINFLALVSHEYFHTWNVKRIRPKELGPFNYLKEATTKLLWLAEGLTSFMDELFIYRAGLISLDEYLEMQKDNLNKYYSHPGKKFHSLDDSSFNAWIKLYRPDENSMNSSISYYLKGGIVFFGLNILLAKKGKNINHLLKMLWNHYEENKNCGINSETLYTMIEAISDKKTREEFERMTSTTEDIDLESLCLLAGISFIWDKTETPWLGMEVDFLNDRVLIKTVTLDGPAFRAGLNAGDEIIGINNLRILKDRFVEFPKFLKINESYSFTVSRLNSLLTLNLNIGTLPPKLKSLNVVNKEKAESVLNPTFPL